MRIRTLLILLLLLLLLASAGVVLSAPLAAPVPTLERSVMAAGGGRGEDVGSGMVMLGTAGQSIVGHSPLGDDSLCTGFWCSGDASYPVYLPLVSKNF